VRGLTDLSFSFYVWPGLFMPRCLGFTQKEWLSWRYSNEPSPTLLTRTNRIMAKPINTAGETQQDPDSDEGLWRRGPGDYVPISEMSENDIRLAYYKAVQKIGEHGDKIVRHQASIRKFFQKANELEEEANQRGISMSAVTPRQALEDALELTEA
jgi:hypothetical protein